MLHALELLLLLSAVVSFAAADSVKGPITPHFKNWLDKNGYGADDFERKAWGTQGSYGGKQSDADEVKRIPVVFIHGNSDAALAYGSLKSGWDKSIDYFQNKGEYTPAELYAVSWGDANALHSGERRHDCPTVGRVRRFIEAVHAYTGAEKLSIISHSMGVTLARKAVKGGPLNDGNVTCNIGKPLKYVDAFIGLAGANFGLCTCEGAAAYLQPSCNPKTGFWPGDSCGFNYLTCGLPIQPWPCNAPTYSELFTQLNLDITREGARVISAWSAADDVIMSGDQVWGRPTSLIPRSSGKKTYLAYSHMNTKELTVDDQLAWLQGQNP